MDDIWCLLEMDHASSLRCHLRGEDRGMAKSDLQTGYRYLYIPIGWKRDRYLYAVIKYYRYSNLCNQGRVQNLIFSYFDNYIYFYNAL